MLLEGVSVTDVDKKRGDFVDANGARHRWSAVTGRDIIAALASSPLAEVQFDRLTIKPKARDISLRSDAVGPFARDGPLCCYAALAGGSASTE